MTTTNKYIIGEDGQGKLNGGNTTILQDLKMSRKDFDALPDDVKEELVNWKLNTGRGTTDLVMIAGGGNWTGLDAYEKNSPTADQIKNIDLSKLTKSNLRSARQTLYKGRIEGLQNQVNEKGENAIEPKSGRTYGALLKEAKKGYYNSQQYR